MKRSESDRPGITVDTIELRYRKPVWMVSKEVGRACSSLVPAEMIVNRVVIPPTEGTGAYDISREIAARFDVPPELVRPLIRTEKGTENVIYLTNDPGPMAIPESALLDLFRGGIPCHEYHDAWSIFQVVAFDERPTHGHLVRLAEVVGEPIIDVTRRAALVRFINRAEDSEWSYAERGGRREMSEGEYLSAEVGYRLERRGQTLAWDENELRNLYLDIPYVKRILKSFRRGHSIPETWVSLNLAYAVRTAWFLQQRTGVWWRSSDWDDLDLAIAWECSLFGENNHL